MMNDAPPERKGIRMAGFEDDYVEATRARREYWNRVNALPTITASQLVSRLQELIEEHGDLPVFPAGYYCNGQIVGITAPDKHMHGFTLMPPQDP